MAEPTVPEQYLSKVNRLRRFLNDTVSSNALLDGVECSDLYLYECIEDAVDEINFVGMLTSYTIDTFPSWVLVRTGATLNVLIGKGILSARNTVTYNDSGGVTIHEEDTFGRYINFYNILIGKYRQQVLSFKISTNIDNGYGGVASEYAQFWDDPHDLFE
ncbi:hypothetical protein KAR91_67845 [Candidatus Pacearchaeota archaeon]|nr:hypothetical protein [Candidatus Pacearchaeota archaeon]